MRASSAILLAMLVAASSVVVRVYLSGGVTALKRGAITTAHTMLTVPNMFLSDSRGLPADCLALETLMRFRRRPETIGSDSEEVALSRNGLDGLDVLFPPHDCVITEKNASNVKTFRLHPRSVSTASKNVIIYLHGGAYIGGSLKSHGAFACELGAAAKATVLFVDYTRAPEKLHPGGVEEAITAIKWISSYGRIDMSNVIIVGDSAGGGMALLATQHFIKLKSRMPQAVVVLSPWADLTATAASLTSNAERDYVLNPARTRNWVRIILGENASNASSPAYSPLFGSFSRFPPLYISVGTAEGLYDDSIAVAKKALDAGAPVELSECPHMQHVVPFFRHFCSNADKEFENIVRFMLSHFNRV